MLRTPHIDSIAARGTAFDRFYVASPVCKPNRASLMTGRMPSVHDVRSNGIPLSMNAVTFVDLLRDAGYRTALIGKSHLQNFTVLAADRQAAAAARGLSRAVRRPDARRCATISTTGTTSRRRRDYWTRSPTRRCRRRSTASITSTLVRAHGDEPGGDYDRWLAERDPKAKAPAWDPNNSLPHDYKVPQAYRTAIPEELYATSFLGDRARLSRRTPMPTHRSS